MAGVTRKVVLEICARMGLVAREGGVTLAGLRRVEGIFLTQSSRGIVEVSALDGEAVSRSEVIRRLQAAYLDSVATP
jgi:branched-subunit amino acid aminotransferase/4-amino-4-deoxychorismate lyase